MVRVCESFVYRFFIIGAVFYFCFRSYLERGGGYFIVRSCIWWGFRGFVWFLFRMGIGFYLVVGLFVLVDLRGCLGLV